jgi:hypothetical protein
MAKYFILWLFASKNNDEVRLKEKNSFNYDTRFSTYIIMGAYIMDKNMNYKRKNFRLKTALEISFTNMITY